MDFGVVISLCLFEWLVFNRLFFMKSDIEIARECELRRIDCIAEGLNIPLDGIEHYGRYMAKVPESLIDDVRVDRSNLVLVTAITPTKAGIGKTTVSVGLALGLNRIGKNAVVALREPSLGPCFGQKGGAAGGGYAQVLPMDKINLHFTGDFHAITSAHNMISAVLDNYIYQHRNEGFAMREVVWKRVLDINDRNLRFIVTGLGSRTDGVTMESGFDITPASEIMAILCLASGLDDLRRRIDNIFLGTTIGGEPFRVKDLGVSGAIVALLMDAIHPNLVQTTENTPAFVHGGPFANIAHGCSSVLSTKLAMTFGDYVITEAGFGADLGAEKFFDIKCRMSGLTPKLTVIVATTQGLKMHGGVDLSRIKEPDSEGLRKGLKNLDRHIANMRGFGQSVVVCLNRYATDVDEELDIVGRHCAELGVRFAVNNAFTDGGAGAVDLANVVVDEIEHNPSGEVVLCYRDEDDVRIKIENVCRKIYGAASVTFSKKAVMMMSHAKELGAEAFPVCIAKTQYSFSADQTKYGCPEGFDINIRDIVYNCGAEMIVAIAGDILRMPGLPYSPQAERIDVVDGNIEGLS